MIVCIQVITHEQLIGLPIIVAAKDAKEWMTGLVCEMIAMAAKNTN